MLFQFPEGYPGECLYSILCRFHERSANRTSKASIQQLFGKRKSIRNTLYSPSALAYADSWFMESDVMSRSRLYNNHTIMNYAIPVGLCYSSEYLDRNGVPTASYSFSNNLIHHERKLRYCPQCARQQKSLYGEAYWQILPQIEGIEICPIHGELYRSSTVSISDISYNFYPASSVLLEEGNADDIPDNLSVIESHYDVYRIVAKDADWLLKNGATCETRRTKRFLSYFKMVLELIDLKDLNYQIENSGLGDIPVFNRKDSLLIYLSFIFSAPQ